MKITKLTTTHYCDILLTDPNFTGLVEDAEGDRAWYKNGLLHNEFGAAEIFSDGIEFWCLEGVDYYTKADYDEELLNYKMRRILDSL
jgi:hypothetical protein